MINLDIIECAELAVIALVEQAQTGGPLSRLKARGNVSSRAKWLLNEIAKLKAEIRGDEPGEEYEPTPEAIREACESIKAFRGAAQRHGVTT